MKKVLLLNADYLPLDIIDIEKAYIHLSNKKADIVYEYDEPLKGVKNDWPYPSVIRLKHYAKVNKQTKIYEPYNRRNVYRRDEGECQYCGKTITYPKMTIDHVNPRALGGKTNWTNIVTSCKKCNTLKDCVPLDETGMKLRNQPVMPFSEATIQKGLLERLKMKTLNNENTVHEKWKDFLMWMK